MASGGTGSRAEFRQKNKNDDSIGDSNSFFLHMVVDKERNKQRNPTEMYVKFAKVMMICQGPYTEDRIRALNKIPKVFKYSSCLISDETFCKDTKTKCSVETTEKYYSYFLNSCKKALEDGNNLIVLDPTLSNVKQNALYMAMAYKMQYVFFVVPPFITSSNKPNWKRESLALSYREVNTFIQCPNMFQHLFCAWYLHDMDSFALRHEASMYIKDCIENISEFAEMFSRICPHESTDSDDEWGDPDYYSRYDSDNSAEEGTKAEPRQPKCTPASINEYFNLGDKRQDLAYCVVKIFHDSMKSIYDYFKKKETLSFYGKMSKLMIVGFIVSPHMIAARVKLAHNQRPLWDIEDEVVESNEREVANLICPSELVKNVKADLPDGKVNLISSKSNQTLVGTGKRIYEPLDIIPVNCKGRSCHIVLGKAPKAQKHNIDYEVAFALTREKNFKKKNADVEITELENCVVKRLGRFWLIYLKEILSVDGFMATCCKPFPYDYAMK